MLNAGKNKLKSMNEISSLVNLRALILNGESYDANHECVFASPKLLLMN